MRAIINADDLGLTEESNAGISEAIKRGWITQSTIVTNSPHSEAGANIAHELGFDNRVGLHLNLSEQLALSPTIRTLSKYSNGTHLDFTPEFMLSESYGKSPFVTYVSGYNTDEFRREVVSLRDEIRAQIERFCSLGFRCNHIDAHRNALVELPVWLAAKPLISEYGFKTIRPVFDSFATSDLYNQLYRTWMEAERDNEGLKTVRYSSSAPRLIKRRSELSSDETIEVYVHPIEVNGILIDNFTNGCLLDDDIRSMDNLEKTSYFEL